MTSERSWLIKPVFFGSFLSATSYATPPVNSISSGSISKNNRPPGGHPLQNLRPFINLWRCYALSHGMAFILETDPGWVKLPELAGKRPILYIIKLSNSWISKNSILRLLECLLLTILLALHHPDQTSPHPGKAPAANWMRWFAAERFLYFYEALLKLELTLGIGLLVGIGLMRTQSHITWFENFQHEMQKETQFVA